MKQHVHISLREGGGGEPTDSIFLESAFIFRDEYAQKEQ